MKKKKLRNFLNISNFNNNPHPIGIKVIPTRMIEKNIYNNVIRKLRVLGCNTGCMVFACVDLEKGSEGSGPLFFLPGN